MRQSTKAILIFTTVALSLYDVAAVLIGGVDATISRVIVHAASEYPIIAVAAGILIGHLFWPQRIKSNSGASEK